MWANGPLFPPRTHRQWGPLPTATTWKQMGLGGEGRLLASAPATRLRPAAPARPARPNRQSPQSSLRCALC